jgi:hypothetical protein
MSPSTMVSPLSTTLTCLPSQVISSEFIPAFFRNPRLAEARRTEPWVW